MTSDTSFIVKYDAASDVLYITKRVVPASKGVEDRFGIVWRYDGAGELIGATVVDFLDIWSNRGGELAHELSEHFDIQEGQARVVVEHALDFRGHEA